MIIICFSICKNKDQIKTFLSSDFKIINNWFYEKFTVLNLEKSDFMCIGEKFWWCRNFKFQWLGNKEVDILEIMLDRHIKFHTNIKNISRKAGQKLRKILLYKSIINSQFNYCPLLWMFCSRQSNNSINKVHGRGLRLTYRDETKDF